MKKIAILQSNYIPWKGYFDLINMVDEFILYDNVQYTKNDWRNRNKIQTQKGVQWLTIPVRQRSLVQKIMDTKTTDNKWRKKHWNALCQNYSKSKYFTQYRDIFENLYLNSNEDSLSKINYVFITETCKILGIKTKIRWSTEFKAVEGQTENLLAICKDCNAETYVSGPAAKNYLNKELAKKEHIELEWMDYREYPEYTQLFQPFIHGVSILDLIFNEGHNSTKFMKSFK